MSLNIDNFLRCPGTPLLTSRPISIGIAPINYEYLRLIGLVTALIRYFGVQFFRMDCVPACGVNGNSHNVAGSQPSLHSQGAPLGYGGLYKWQIDQNARLCSHMVQWLRLPPLTIAARVRNPLLEHRPNHPVTQWTSIINNNLILIKDKTLKR